MLLDTMCQGSFQSRGSRPGNLEEGPILEEDSMFWERPIWRQVNKKKENEIHV